MSLVNIILISWIPHKQDQWRNKVGAAIGADAPGGTFWRGGVFDHQRPKNVDLHIKSFSC